MFFLFGTVGEPIFSVRKTSKARTCNARRAARLDFLRRLRNPSTPASKTKSLQTQIQGLMFVIRLAQQKRPDSSLLSSRLHCDRYTHASRHDSSCKMPIRLRFQTSAKLTRKVPRSSLLDIYTQSFCATCCHRICVICWFLHGSLIPFD